jgi:hypothetical protein
MSHAQLHHLSREEVAEDVGRAKEALEARVGEVRHFSWPYGRFGHFTPAAAEEVWRAGYRSCASAERGAHVAPAGDPRSLCIRREHTVAGWPAGHATWFVARSARRAAPGDERWPPGWTETP